MVSFKKLLFAPFFILVFAFTVFQLSEILKSYDLIFSLSLDSLISVLAVSGLIVFSSLLFVLFATLSQDWKFILPAGILASALPLLFMPPSLGLIFTVGLIVSFTLVYLGLENTLKTYVNFNPATVLGPSIRHLSSLIILVFCIIYFFSINKIIADKGFEIPDSLIDTALEFTSPQEQSDSMQIQPPLPTISPEQLELLRQNPNLLEQSGLNPSILDTLNQPQKAAETLARDFIKQAVKDQLQGIIKPYLGVLPAVLSLLLFLLLQSLTSLLNLFTYSLLWVVFYVLEKTGFVKFVVETRSVKKMVI